MKLTIKNGSENYAATIVKINNIHQIEGADKIVRTVIFNNNVIVTKDVKIGDKMIYFCSGTRLSHDFCKFNSLFTDKTLNINNETTGYISPKQRRVKALKLRGIISDGILLPVESLSYLQRVYTGYDIPFYDYLKVGDTFTSFNNVDICEKYIITPPRNTNPGGKAPKTAKFNRLIDNQFYFHNSTENLKRNLDKLNLNDIIGIHYKKHGTSVVISNIITKKPLKWWEKLLQKLGVKVDDKIYDIVYSSRSVIKNKSINVNSTEGFYGEDIWGVVAKEVGHLIPKNWTLYGEIVGFTPKGGAIQHGYDYGCDPHKAEHKFYVYKISVVNPDGKVIYLTDKQIQEWCDKVGLLYSDTFIYYGNINNLFESKEFMDWDILAREKVKDTWQETLLDYLESKYTEKNCCMCVNKVPEEGIVLRVEKLEYYEAYKLKSKRFLLKESEDQEKEIINIEDNQDE